MRRTEIERLLPGVFQRTLQEGTPLYALLEAMEALTTPAETILDQLDAFFDPYRSPDTFLPFLAGWIDLDWLVLPNAQESKNQVPELLPGGMGQLRELVAAAPFLAQWRGTSKGLLRFLETATGVQGFTLDERVPGPDQQTRPFHMCVHVPSAARNQRLLIERIIESEKPAYVTYELEMPEDLANGNTPAPEQRA